MAAEASTQTAATATATATGSQTAWNLLFSSTAALVSRTLTHPLDTLKTRIQFSRSTTTTTTTTLPAKPATLTSIFTTLLRTDPAALYRGLGVTLLFSVPGTAVYLTAYDDVKRRVGGDGLLAHAVAGAGAEAVSGLFWTPMEVLKMKLQMGSEWWEWEWSGASGGAHNSTVALARHVYATHGLRGFYRGYLLSQAVFIPYTVVYFVTYERLKRGWAWAFIANRGGQPTSSNSHSNHNHNQQQRQQQLPFTGYLVCSSAAGALAGAVSNILDVVKTRVQVSSARSTWAVVRELWMHEGGPLAFTRGMLARIVWVTPSMAISVSVYELLKAGHGGGDGGSGE